MDQPHPLRPPDVSGLTGPAGPAGVVAAANTLITGVDEELWAARTPEELLAAHDGAGGVWLKGRGTLEDAALIKAALLPLTKPTPATTPVNATATDPAPGSETAQTCGAVSPDPRDHSTRMWDALVPGLPTHPGHRRRRPHPRRPRHPRQVLDVGRSNRLITPALWTALVARDHHCAFPGCTRPPVMCRAHHITHWADGGTTALLNLVMLCGHHHRLIHDTPWQVRINPSDGHPEFQPPPRHGLQQAWT